MQGWIKLHRELLKKPIWKCSTPEQKSILVSLLLMANHEQKEWEWRGRPYKCKAGEFITSLDKIKRKAGKGVSIQNIRTALKKFSEKYEFLTIETTKIQEDGTKIIISNWASYQNEINKGINKGITKRQHTPNKELTTNKNDKNENNEKKNIYGEFKNIFLSEIEHKKLNSIYSCKLNEAIEILSSYIASKGAKYRSHYAVLGKSNWVYKKIFGEKPMEHGNNSSNTATYHKPLSFKDNYKGVN